MRIAICEDIPKDTRRLADMLKRYELENRLELTMDVFENAEALLDAFVPQQYQILFMDVYLGGLTGVEAIREVRKRDEDCAVIFITTSESHAVEGFSLRATHYLIKPVEYDALCIAMERCKDQVNRFARYIEVMENRESVRIKMRDILYAEVFKNYCVIHTTGGDIKAYMTIDALAEKLGGTPYLRCHRSFLVNLRRVTELRDNEFYLEGGGIVCISKALKNEAKKAYRAFCFALADEGGVF